MSIISKETWDKFSEEEKDSIRKEYDYVRTSKDHDCGFRRVELEKVFGKENLQPEPKIKTWEDVVKEYPHFKDDIDNLKYNILYGWNGLSDKIIATYKIAKLIEFGYGGMMTEEEWKDGTVKFVIKCTPNEKSYLYEDEICNDIEFIAFHTYKQREEFMSYPENVKLVEQYYMI